MARSYARRLAYALAVAAALGACSGDLNPMRDAAVATGIGAERRKGPDFVEKSRPAELDYLPVGVTAPGRSTAAKPAARVKAVEAEMDAARAANEARGAEARKAGATPPPQAPSLRPAAQ
jgi:hypothetical protein